MARIPYVDPANQIRKGVGSLFLTGKLLVRIDQGVNTLGVRVHFHRWDQQGSKSFSDPDFLDFLLFLPPKFVVKLLSLVPVWSRLRV